MSEGQDSRAERITRYKEERRRQLAVQFNTHSDPSNNRRRNSKDANSSSSEGPKTTKTSRLRAAATAQENAASPARNVEKTVVASPSTADSGSRRTERDKSSKRKSNLNRALNSEEVPDAEFDDAKNRRRRRRFFPQEVLEQATNNATKSDSNLTASFLSESTSPITTSSPRGTPKKTELSKHMENARKGVTPSYCEMGKYKPLLRRAVTSSPKEKKPSDLDYSIETKHANKENIKRKSSICDKSSKSDDSTNRSIAKKMDELTALTKETLARVERLACRNSPARVKSNSPLRNQTPSSNRRSSILKKTLFDDAVAEPLPPSTLNNAPISILKRKVSQEDHENAPSTHTPPVTFSPSVVEPQSTNRKQGILKKRRSLDESQVMRHRSCSPDVAIKLDSRSILKNQRRSSLEDLTRTDSPELHLHGILKRKSSRSEEDGEHSLNSPQGILKRRSGASSAGSTNNSPHVSITTAVILAAAEGAEMILEGETVRPILKKKSFSEENTFSEAAYSEVPRPILKKKYSTDTDDCDDRPKPILKPSRNSIDRESIDLKHCNPCDDCSNVRPILKQNGVKEEGGKPRLSFYGNEVDAEDVPVRRRSSRSHTICAEFSVNFSTLEYKEEDRELKKPRPVSVFDLVKSFEGDASTGAIPKVKRSSLKRNERYRTQPVTSNELEASLNFVRSPQLESKLTSPLLCLPNANHSANSLLDFTSSLENDSNLNSFLLSSLHNTTSPDSDTGVCGKMSSDSAFQSLGDGLELDQEEEKAPSKKLETNKLEMQMKAIAQEAQKMKLGKGNAGVQKYRNRKSFPAEKASSNRFSTQPVTLEEVQEASRISKTTDDLEDDQAALEKTSERKSILKSSGSCRLSGDFRAALCKSEFDFDGRKSMYKSEGPDGADEGISCNDSASDSEAPAVNLSNVNTRPRRVGKSSSDNTSDGESSGGREIRSIFKHENRLKVKQTLESVLSKSKSQSAFGDDLNPTPQRKSSSIRRSQTQSEMPRKIAELQAKLQQTGESSWKKRIQQNNANDEQLKLLKDKNRYNEQLSKKSALASRKDELDAASQHWKSRVEKSDAENFTVAKRMEPEGILSLNIPSGKRTPQGKRFQPKDGSDSSSTPVSPDKSRPLELIRSYSVPNRDQDSNSSDSSLRSSGRKVSVARPDDYTFKNFYKSVEVKTTTERVEVTVDDFDAVPRQMLLVQKKNVSKVQRRRGATNNPVKALASRTDVSNEYTEVITGVAERETRRLNIEKLTKTSNLAVEALAGLASNEDFTSVVLKKSTYASSLAPFKDVMLLQVKGRRHVQTRLVEPVASSINEGDCFVLVTRTTLYNYTGAYSNIIEQARATDIVHHIQHTGDLGCKEVEVVSIDSRGCAAPKHMKKFLGLLGGHSQCDFTPGGHPDEDEVYESNMLATNMVYEVEDDTLVPFESQWGTAPEYKILETKIVLVFDFGTEMYVWSGKSAPIERKNTAVRLAKKLWEEGFNYSEYSVCPLNVASILGNRSPEKAEVRGTRRPDWALFSKITQHRETILFKDKFLDWPDFSRVIQVKKEDDDKFVDPSYHLEPCNVEKMLAGDGSQPDLVIEGHHLGRGHQFFDEETKRLFEFDTVRVSAWRILEKSSEELCDKAIGHFYDSESYIIKWHYKMTVKGRELTGKPSKHGQTGREKIVYFCWQGCHSSINEKGAAALLAVHLDKEHAPHVRVVQDNEPSAFLRLFQGSMVVHRGKREDMVSGLSRPRLFMLRGELPGETSLLEVPLEQKQMRSRTSFLLVVPEEAEVLVWHGAKSGPQSRKRCKEVAAVICDKKAVEFGLRKCSSVDLVEMGEGKEKGKFAELLEGKRDGYLALLRSDLEFDFTSRLFHLSSTSGPFQATEILCPHRSEYSSPYPFLQEKLYSANQPALFLIENHHELWLWQGWWPEREEKEAELGDQTGSGAVRWQAERKTAMQTAVNYWHEMHGVTDSVPAFLVWAGLEPLEFKNLFPSWTEKEDVAELNIKSGRQMGAKIPLERQLVLLSKTIYPLAELLQRPLPEGVDPTHLEIYLSPEDFRELLSISKEEFQKLPVWKQKAMKKEKGLF